MSDTEIPAPTSRAVLIALVLALAYGAVAAFAFIGLHNADCVSSLDPGVPAFFALLNNAETVEVLAFSLSALSLAVMVGWSSLPGLIAFPVFLGFVLVLFMTLEHSLDYGSFRVNGAEFVAFFLFLPVIGRRYVDRSLS